MVFVIASLFILMLLLPMIMVLIIGTQLGSLIKERQAAEQKGVDLKRGFLLQIRELGPDAARKLKWIGIWVGISFGVWSIASIVVLVFLWTQREGLPNQPDRAKRRQPLGLREPLSEVGATGSTAAVTHPER